MQRPDPFIVPDLRSGKSSLTCYRWEDAEWVARLAGPFEVARFTGLPHPMGVDEARTWIGKKLEGIEAGTDMAWAVRVEGQPIGSGTLRLQPEMSIARFGFWIGQDHWGQGYGSLIAKGLTDYAFDVLQVRRLEADCVAENRASGRALEACGFQLEGRLRGGFHRFGATHDVTVYGALRSDRRAER